MKKILPALLLCLFAVPSHAVAEDYKIGVVDLLRILEKAPQADEARNKIETEFSAKESELSGLQKKLVSMEGKLAKDRDVLSESELRELEREIISQRREIKRLQDEYREDLSYRRNEELGKLQKLIKETIQSLAKAKDYDLVLGEGLIYVSPKMDFTDEVIEKLGEQSARDDSNGDG
ncbi:MAG: OmpH family outer membrane protein [Candidatus Porifericomitaceae bacterium WSBS_2022_MAG_OTU9]